MTTSTTPSAAYRERLDARGAEAQRLLRQERRISNARMVVFLAAVAMGWFGFDSGLFSAWWAMVPVVAFVALVVTHERIVAERVHAERAAAFYAQGLTRIEDRWMGAGNRGDVFLDAKHPYAADLDIFGAGSLFERLCTARTRSGEELLARWLIEAGGVEEIRNRQAAVTELTPQLDLREALALAGEDVRVGLDIDILSRWSSAAPLPHLALYRGTAVAAVALGILCGVCWGLGASALPFLIAAVGIGLVACHLRVHVHRIVHAVQHPSRDLAVFSELLCLLESQTFTAAKLKSLRACLDTEGEAASRRCARLRRLVHLLDAMKNQVFAPLGILILWETHLALAIEAWRVRYGAAVGEWLRAVSEIEVLCALATFAYENPDAVFPTLSEGDPCFDAEGLGHPLLTAAGCVRNDVHLGAMGLDAQPRTLIVSGSNMSGKSTLLRAVGINAVLAFAGAPVRARRLHLSRLNVGASIRTLDSLQEGTSRFYAEIKRIRQLMDLANGSPPLLFLLDEVLHGTNSHDRGIGAEAVVRGFLERGAIGLVTTHDLALARVADALAPVTANVHFEDHLEDGEMRFDYKMRAGVVTHSNALALMRAVGLDV